MLQLVGLAVQVRRTTGGTISLEDTDPRGVRLIRLWANALISPPERLIHSSTTGTATLWSKYIDLVHVRQQNQNLETTVDRLRLEQAALLEDARQGERLQAILGFQQRYIYSTLAAQVYGSSGSDHSHVFYIDKGWHEGLKPDMAVITAEGIVGKVRDVFPHTAQVLAVNDTTSGAGVILETTRIRGVLRGDAIGQLEVVGVTADERIQPGEHVQTAGGDLIFPRGLAVGVVKKVVRDPDRDGLVDIILTPAAPLDRLDEVLVITSTEPRFSPQQEQDLSKSAAEQGAVPAAIKDQMKASEIMAEKLPGLIDPNLPPDQQPLNDSSNPTIAPRPPQPLHPDQYSASTNDDSGAPPDAGAPDHSSTAPAGPQAPAPKPKPQTTPRNP
jgi:rod shape-determining protein MreC